MKISTILDHIDNGHMALPEFQRGFVWNRDQIRGLFHSLYHHHPIGGLLVWVTESRIAQHRGDGLLAPGVVKLLLDGQQRMTSLYGVLRGHPPRFFDGNAQVFRGLCFHLEQEIFSFYQPIKMKDDHLWIDVTDLMQKGTAAIGQYYPRFSREKHTDEEISVWIGRLSNLLSITDIDLHIEEVTGQDKTLDIVVDIFNRVNSGGTKLSKGDLALARICADWPEARDTMKETLNVWSNAGFQFSLDWLLRSLNTVLTGEARFQHLHDRTADEIRDGLKRAAKHVDTALNMIGGRLGLDHDRVFFGRFGVPVMVRYLDQQNGALNEKERDKLLFWFVQAGMWGRFSGSTESYIDQDLAALEGPTGGLDNLLEKLRLWHGGLQVEPGNFSGWSMGARFYPVLYMLTRMGQSSDWGTGLPLKAGLLGKMNKLEVHHIFPKSALYKQNYRKPEVNALANFCFLTKDTNLSISDRLPEDYFPMVEDAHPGVLASQWIPMDPNLWKIQNYPEFLEARRILLAAEMNRRMADLLHGEDHWLTGETLHVVSRGSVGGGITSQDEETELNEVNTWVESLDMPRGTIAYDYADPDTGEQRAVLDLAWPNGLQEGLSQPVAILINEESTVVPVASQAGYRCFTNVNDFKAYVKTELLVEDPVASVS